MDNVDYLTFDEIAAVNYDTVRETGEPYNVLLPGNLTHLLDRVKTIGGDKNEKHAMAVKASWLLQKIAGQQIFAEANKRTAFQVMALFLDINGWRSLPTEWQTWYTLLLKIGRQLYGGDEALRVEVERYLETIMVKKEGSYR